MRSAITYLYFRKPQFWERQEGTGTSFRRSDVKCDSSFPPPLSFPSAPFSYEFLDIESSIPLIPGRSGAARSSRVPRRSTASTACAPSQPAR